MIISDISVKRPVFASVISLLLIAFGLVSFERLSLREYPDIDPPIVTVAVDYPGAPANVIETRITEIIEDRISGIEGIEYIESSSRDGRSRVTIEFSIDRDIDSAANDVRERIAGVQANLPEEADPPEVQKVDSSDDVVIWQNLASSEMSTPELTDYAERYLVDQYSTLSGVARVRVGGGFRYAMRIWLDRNAMTARQLSVSDIEQALRSENVELPAGRLESNQRVFKARVARHFNTAEDFSGLVVSAGKDGSLVRLGDVARVERGLREDRTIFRGNGDPMVGIGIVKQSNANTITVARGVKALTKKLNENLPNGMTINQSYDASVFIESAVNEVYTTLFIAISFVILVIFLFLGNWRAMLIPAVTVPVSVTATFIVIYALGFSINLLTLLALVLAIGLVVDDAIVMLENIVRRMQENHETPLVAAYRGARQVGFAVVATTMVLVAVFVPITFLEGDLGRLFTEFSLTIAAAVIFSSLVALTLSPMLASVLLKPEQNKNKSLKAIDNGIRRSRRLYGRWLVAWIRRPIYMMILFVVIIVATVWLYSDTAQEFTPIEDRGSFFVRISGPEGASFEYMEEYMNEIERRLLKYVEDGRIDRMLVRAPLGFGSIESFNGGFVVARLKAWEERDFSAFDVMDEIKNELADLPGVRAFPVMRQGLGGGTGKPVRFVLGGSSYEELAGWRDILITEIEKDNPGLEGLDSDYKETRPQIDFNVDYDAAADLGVRINDIGRTLQTMLSGRNVTTFIDDGEEYDVILEGERAQQRTFKDVENIYVRSQRSDELIPLSNLVTINEYGAADNLTRYNRMRAITIEANLAEGYRLGDALDYLNTMVDKHLPDYAIVDYKGQSRDFINSGSSIMFVFLLGLVVVFLVLAAQFESYIHPFVIMLTVPLALAGGLFGLWLTGGSINIYSQIGLIILVGLATKNGILIVEFANQMRDQGYRFNRAILTAARVRYRPIIMTGLTTVAGAIPLVIASGAGAETRIVIGVVILFGVIAATVFTLFVIPVAYNLLARGTGSPGDVARNLTEQSKIIPNRQSETVTTKL